MDSCVPQNLPDVYLCRTSQPTTPTARAGIDVFVLIEPVEFALEPIPEPFIQTTSRIGTTSDPGVRRIIASIPNPDPLYVFSLFVIAEQKAVAGGADM